MAEKPPDIITQQRHATTKQAPTIILFPPSQQFSGESLESELLPLHYTAFSLIVVILSSVSLANSFCT